MRISLVLRVGQMALFSLLLVASWATELRVMSWNFARAVGANNPNDAQQPYVAKIWNYFRPDVILLHEVGGNSSGWNALNQESALDNFIRANLTYLGANPQRNVNYYLYVNRLSDGWISSAIVSRYPLVSATDVSIGSPNRGLTIGFVDVPGTNGVGFFGAHFKAGGYTTDAEKRQTNAEQARAHVNRWRYQNRRSAYLFGGDLNENEDPDLNSLYDIGALLPDGRVYNPISTVQSARLRDHVPTDGMGGKRTYKISSRNSDLDQRFDYLFTSADEPGRDRIRVLEARIFNTRRMSELPEGFEITDSQNASDHAPVFLRIQIDRWHTRPDGSGYWVPEPSSWLILAGLSGALLIRRRHSIRRLCQN